jgi:hypothetical protein
MGGAQIGIGIRSPVFERHDVIGGPPEAVIRRDAWVDRAATYPTPPLVAITDTPPTTDFAPPSDRVQFRGP